MKKLGLLLVVAAVLLLAVMAFFSLYVGASSSLAQKSAAPTDELIEKGAYLARAGDCVACHTAPGGKPFAGGLAIASPIGAIYSTNITPHATGLGAYGLREFDMAVRHGVRSDGATLYPAMPYPSYAILHDEDIEALYAYFQHGVEPVDAANRAADIPWPLSMRWPLTGWRLIFAPEVAAFQPAPGQDAIVARGAYLTQGPGHCGACHTPRAITLNEKAYSENGPNGGLFLSGSAGAIDGWVAINLRGDHKDGLGGISEEQLVQLMKTGRNDHSAVFGGMSDVVLESLQHLTDEDLVAIARYLKQIPPVNPANPPFVYDERTAKALYAGDASAPGAMGYVDSCAACHRTDGKGYKQTFPALAGNPVVQGDDPASLVAIIMLGHRLEGTMTAPTAYSMPPMGWRYNEREIADLVTFIRTSWGNQGKPVSEAEVRALIRDLPQ